MSSDNRARIAELEQSEAVLRCQLINIEDQLIKTKQDLNFSREQNDNLAEQCEKLKNCLDLLDAEKLLLDDLKLENKKLREKLGQSEAESFSVVEKLAKLTQTNADLQHQNDKMQTLNQKYKEESERMQNILDENQRLQQECYSVGESCLALEDVKESLAERCSQLELEINSETCKSNGLLEELNLEIRSLNQEKSALEEKTEELRQERELHATMQEKLIEQVEELQNKIEILKNELAQQKVKNDSIDMMKANLNAILQEKENLEETSIVQKKKIYELQNEIDKIKESYEESNLTLMQETNKLSQKYRESLEENEKLNFLLKVKEVDIKLNKNLRKQVDTLLTRHQKNFSSSKFSDVNEESSGDIEMSLDKAMEEIFPASNIIQFKQNLLKDEDDFTNLKLTANENLKLFKSFSTACENVNFYKQSANTSAMKVAELDEQLQQMRRISQGEVSTSNNQLEKKVKDLEKKLKEANDSLDGSATQIQKFVNQIMSLQDEENLLKNQLHAARNESKLQLETIQVLENKMKEMELNHMNSLNLCKQENEENINFKLKNELQVAEKREKDLISKLNNLEEELKVNESHTKKNENNFLISQANGTQELKDLKRELDDERETLKETKLLFAEMQEKQIAETKAIRTELEQKYQKELEHLQNTLSQKQIIHLENKEEGENRQKKPFDNSLKTKDATDKCMTSSQCFDNKTQYEGLHKMECFEDMIDGGDAQSETVLSALHLKLVQIHKNISNFTREYLNKISISRKKIWTIEDAREKNLNDLIRRFQSLEAKSLQKHPQTLQDQITDLLKSTEEICEVITEASDLIFKDLDQKISDEKDKEDKKLQKIIADSRASIAVRNEDGAVHFFPQHISDELLQSSKLRHKHMIDELTNYIAATRCTESSASVHTDLASVESIRPSVTESNINLLDSGYDMSRDAYVVPDENEDPMVLLLRAENARILQMLDECDSRKTSIQFTVDAEMQANCSETESNLDAQKIEKGSRNNFQDFLKERNYKIGELLETKKELESELNNCDLKIREMEIEDLDKVRKLKASEVAFCTLQDHVRVLEMENKSVNKILKEQQKENKKLKEHLEEIELELKELKKSEQNLQASFDKVFNECNILIKFSDKSKSEKKCLQEVINHLEDSIRSQNKQLQIFEDEFKVLQTKLDKSEDTNKNLKISSGSKDDSKRVDQIDMENKKLVEMMNNVATENESLKKTLNLMKLENDNLSNIQEKFSSKTNEEIKKLMRFAENKKKDLNEIESKYCHDTDIFEKMLEECKEKENKIIAENNCLKSTIEKQNIKCKRLENETVENQLLIEKLTKEMENSASEKLLEKDNQLLNYQQQIRQLKMDLEQLANQSNTKAKMKQEEIDASFQELKKKSEQIYNLENKTRDLETSTENLEVDLHKMKTELQQAYEEIDLQLDKVKELQNHKIENIKRLEEILIEKSELEETNKTLKNVTSSMDAKIQSLEKSVKIHREKEDQTKIDLNEIQNIKQAVETIGSQLNLLINDNELKLCAVEEDFKKLKEFEIRIEKCKEIKRNESDIGLEEDNAKLEEQNLFNELTNINKKNQEKLKELQQVLHEQNKHTTEICRNVESYENESIAIRRDIKVLESLVIDAKDDSEISEDGNIELRKALQKLELQKAEESEKVTNLQKQLIENKTMLEKNQNITKKFKESLCIALNKNSSEDVGDGIDDLNDLINNFYQTFLPHAEEKLETKPTTIRNKMLSSSTQKMSSIISSEKILSEEDFISNLRNQLKEKTEKVDEMESTNAELEKTVNLLKYTMEQADKMIFDREKVFEEEILDMKEALKRSNDFNNEVGLQEEIRELEAVKTDLNQKLEKSLKDFDAIKKEKEMFHQQAKELRYKLDEVEEDNEDLQRRISSSMLERAKMQGCYDKLKETVESLQQRIRILLESKNQSNQQLEAQKHKIEELESDKFQLKVILDETNVLKDAQMISNLNVMRSSPNSINENENLLLDTKEKRNNLALIDEIQIEVINDDVNELPYGVDMNQVPMKKQKVKSFKSQSSQTLEDTMLHDLEKISLLQRGNTEMNLKSSVSSETKGDEKINSNSSLQEQHLSHKFSEASTKASSSTSVTDTPEASLSPRGKHLTNKILFEDAFVIAEDIRQQLLNAEVDNKELQDRLSSLKSECQSMLEVVEEDLQVKKPFPVAPKPNFLINEDLQKSDEEIPQTIEANIEGGSLEISSPREFTKSVSLLKETFESLERDEKLKSLEDQHSKNQSMESERSESNSEEVISREGNRNFSTIAESQDEKDALEREIGVLRGQIALLERNNKLFTDDERRELKQDLELATKRCNNYKIQLQALKESLDYEKMDALRLEVDEKNEQINMLKENIQEVEIAKKEEERKRKIQKDKNSAEEEEKQKKYERLRELERQARDLQYQLDEKDSTIRNKEHLIGDLNFQIEQVQHKYNEEVKTIQKTNREKLRKIEKEKRELEFNVEEHKNAIKAKKAALHQKSDLLIDREAEISKLENLVQRKDRVISKLEEEISRLKRENDALRERIEKLKAALATSVASDHQNLLSSRSHSLNYIPSLSSSTSRSRSPPKSASSSPKRSYQSLSAKSDGYRSDHRSEYISPPSRATSRGRSRRSSVQNYDPTDEVTHMIREDIADARHTVDEMGNLLSASVSPSRPKSNLSFQPLDDSFLKDHRGSDGSSLSPVRRYKDSNDEKKRRGGRDRRVRNSSPHDVASERSSRKSKIKEPIIYPRNHMKSNKLKIQDFLDTEKSPLKIPKSREESCIKYPSIKKRMIPKNSLLDVKRSSDQKKPFDEEGKRIKNRKIKTGKKFIRDEDKLSINQSEGDSEDLESFRYEEKTKQRKLKKDKIKKEEEGERTEKSRNKLEIKPTKKRSSEKKDLKIGKKSHKKIKDQISSTESESIESEEAIESDSKQEKYKMKKKSSKKIGKEKMADLKDESLEIDSSDDSDDLLSYSKKLKNKKNQTDVSKKTSDTKSEATTKDINKSCSSDDGDEYDKVTEIKERENYPRITKDNSKSKYNKIKKLKPRQKTTEAQVKGTKPNLKEIEVVTSSNSSDSTDDQEDDKVYRKAKKDQKQRSTFLSSSFDSEDVESSKKNQQSSSQDDSEISPNKSVKPKITIEDESVDEDSESSDSSDSSDRRSREDQRRMKLKDQKESSFADPSKNFDRKKNSKKEESSKKRLKESKNKNILSPKSSKKIKNQQICDDEDLKDNLPVEHLTDKKQSDKTFDPVDIKKEDQSIDLRSEAKKSSSSEEDLIEETQDLKPITESQMIAEEMNNLQYISNDSAVSSADEIIGSSLKNSSTFNDTGLGLSLPLPRKSDSPTKQSTNQIRDDTEFEISELFPVEDSKPIGEIQSNDDEDTVVDLPKLQESKSVPQNSLSKSSNKDLKNRIDVDDQLSSKLKKESPKDVRKITDQPTHLSVSLDDLKELLQINKEELPSLLPDDRPSLVHEVTKARAEAKKWFEEVTKSDRDKRDMKRKMKEMESELDRLRAVEENLSARVKSDENKEKNLQYDIKNLTDEAEEASRKAEEVKERNALLQAHLRDLKDQAKSKPAPIKPKLKPESIKEKQKEEKEIDTCQDADQTLEDISDSFDYIASNFANLVLRKHQAETKLAPQQAKVSQLKRKCLERDQLLAKLLLKLKHKRTPDLLSSDARSVASSTKTSKLLTKAEKLINPEEQSEENDSVAGSNPEDGYMCPKRPNSALLRALNTSSSPKRPQTSHRIFVAKKDYIPTHENTSLDLTGRSEVSSPTGLLPYLPMKAGDTVVAIGAPEEKEDGQLYQLAEVRAKIGFVPFGHLVAAEQVSGMQEFLEERKLKPVKRNTSSGTEKIVDLFKTLSDANASIADKLSMRSVTPCVILPNRAQRSQSLDRSSITPSHSASNIQKKSRRRESERSRSSSRSQYPDRRNLRSYDDEPVTSTPLPHKNQRSKSKNPPKKPKRLSKKHQLISSSTSDLLSDDIKSRSRSLDRQNRNLSPDVTLPSPPSCPIIEKIMGKGSLLLRWVPPVMDLMSRSNNIPVVGYEVSIDGERRTQISGAFTNQAIIGDVDFSKDSIIQMKTVSSFGTLSSSVNIRFSPSSFKRSTRHTSQSSSIKSMRTRKPKATVLYDYNPVKDSPYSDQEDEISLKQGQIISIIHPERSDGFCKVKSKRCQGWVPAAFLMMEDVNSSNVSMVTSDM